MTTQSEEPKRSKPEMGDGSGGDGGGGSDGGVSDSTGSTDTGGFSVSDFGGFGDNASISDAGLSDAATSGLASGLSGVSATGFGNFGPTDPGSLGVGVGYGGVSGVAGEAPSDANGNSMGSGFGGAGFGALGGGFGAPGTAGSISGPGGLGGIGISGPGNVGSNSISNAGSFGIGIGSDADSGFGNVGIGPTAASFGLGPDNGLGISGPAAQAAISQAIAADLGQLAPSPDPTSTAAQHGPAVSMGFQGFSPTSPDDTSADFGGRFGFQTPNSESPAVTAITNAINDAIGPQAPSFNIPNSPAPTNAELGLPASATLGIGSDMGQTPGQVGIPSATPSQMADAQTSLGQALTGLFGTNPAPATLGIGSDAVAAPNQPSLASQQSINDANIALAAQNNTPNLAPSPPVSMGLQGVNPSPQEATPAPAPALASPSLGVPAAAPAAAPVAAPASTPAASPVGPLPGGQEFANLLAAYPGLQQLLAQLSASGYRA